jgi:hypothetical protein
MCGITYQSLLLPGHTSALVGVSVGVTLNGTGLTTEQAVQVGADLVGTTSLSGMALGATGLSDSVSIARK